MACSPEPPRQMHAAGSIPQSGNATPAPGVGEQALEAIPAVVEDPNHVALDEQSMDQRAILVAVMVICLGGRGAGEALALGGCSAAAC